MKSTVPALLKGFGIIVIGVAIGTAGIYLGELDDSPGASLISILLMIGMVTTGVRTAWRATAHP